MFARLQLLRKDAVPLSAEVGEVIGCAASKLRALEAKHCLAGLETTLRQDPEFKVSVSLGSLRPRPSPRVLADLSAEVGKVMDEATAKLRALEAKYCVVGLVKVLRPFAQDAEVQANLSCGRLPPVPESCKPSRSMSVASTSCESLDDSLSECSPSVFSAADATPSQRSSGLSSLRWHGNDTPRHRAATAAAIGTMRLVPLVTRKPGERVRLFHCKVGATVREARASLASELREEVRRIRLFAKSENGRAVLLGDDAPARGAGGAYICGAGEVLTERRDAKPQLSAQQAASFLQEFLDFASSRDCPRPLPMSVLAQAQRQILPKYGFRVQDGLPAMLKVIDDHFDSNDVVKKVEAINCEIGTFMRVYDLEPAPAS